MTSPRIKLYRRLKSENIPVTDYIVKQCDIIDNSCGSWEIERAYFQLWRDCRFNHRYGICVQY